MMGTQPARGMRDFLPEDVRRREYVVGIIRDVYDRYGFEPLETPAAENIETLLGKYGEEGNKLIFKILKRGEHESTGHADLALRYDLTVPLARVVAEYQARLPKFFKRYQIQPVWRADRPARGRYREFYQCDIDAVGSTSLLIETEMCAAASDVMERLGFSDFQIRLNDRRLLTQALQVMLRLPPAAHADALVALDKLDKIGIDGVAEEFVARGLMEKNPALEALSRMAGFSGVEYDSPAVKDVRQAAKHVKHDPSEDIRKLESLREAVVSAPGLSLDPQPANDLIQILTFTRETSAAGHVRFDSSLARGLSYYTGAVMEITVPDLAGSLAGGGRYDNLIGTFLGTDVPACGFSLGLERILVVMQEHGMFPASVEGAAVDLVVAAIDERAQSAAIATASKARMVRGLRVDLYPDVAKKMEKVFKYADQRRARFLAVLGGDEVANQTVTVRDTQKRTQETVPREAVAEYMAARVLPPSD
jgi:histidyl-tRNA synthetase